MKNDKIKAITSGDPCLRRAALMQMIEEKQGQLTISRQALDALTAERKTLVLVARLQNDSDAQSRIRKIDEESSGLNSDSVDIQTTLDYLKESLATAENEIDLASWEEEREKVRELLEARLRGKTSAALEKAADALVKAFEAVIEEDEQIAKAMVAFEPRLHSHASQMGRLGRARAEIIGFKFRDLLPMYLGLNMTVQSMEGKSVAGYDQRIYGDALEALNCLERVL